MVIHQIWKKSEKGWHHGHRKLWETTSKGNQLCCACRVVRISLRCPYFTCHASMSCVGHVCWMQRNRKTVSRHARCANRSSNKLMLFECIIGDKTRQLRLFFTFLKWSQRYVTSHEKQAATSICFWLWKSPWSFQIMRCPSLWIGCEELGLGSDSSFYTPLGSVFAG